MGDVFAFNPKAGASKRWQEIKNGHRCYDCGSNIPGRHTPKCDMAGPNDKRDLPAQGNTQWWDRQAEIKPLKKD